MRHVHDDLNELFLVLKGCLSVETPQGMVEARSHQAVLYPMGLVHRPFSHSDEELEVIGLAWRGEIETWDMANLVQHDSLGRLRHQLLWMLDTGPCEKAGETPLLDLLGRTVIQEFNRLCTTESPNLVVRTKRFMRENYERPLALQDLAAAVGLNRHYFARVFKSASGETPMRALMTIRLEAAGDLLLHTTLPLKYIAAKTGFSDEAHLSHAFQRFFGRSPGSLRRNVAPPSRDNASAKRPRK